MKKSILLLFLLVTYTGLFSQSSDKFSQQQRYLLEQRLESQSKSSVPGRMLSQPGLRGTSGTGEGVSSQQISEFRKYINSMNAAQGENQDPYYIDERFFVEDSLYRQFIKEEDEKKLKVFGSEIFNRSKVTFEPNLYLPTPANYVIGTNDELLVDIAGLYEVSYNCLLYTSPSPRD